MCTLRPPRVLAPGTLRSTAALYPCHGQDYAHPVTFPTLEAAIEGHLGHTTSKQSTIVDLETKDGSFREKRNS